MRWRWLPNTSGRGHLYLEFAGYAACHDAERVIEAAAYEPEADLPNTPDSVFCAHGAGYTVNGTTYRRGTRKGRPHHLPPLSPRRRNFRPHVTKGQSLCHIQLV